MSALKGGNRENCKLTTTTDLFVYDALYFINSLMPDNT